MINRTGAVEAFWLNEEIECYFKNNLVYVRIRKNASTFYTNLFVSNGRTGIQFKDINWNIHHVFGFIQDPIVRYCKGLTEDLFKDSLEFAEKVTSILTKTPINSAVLTYHTIPISLMVGDRMYEMTWITLDSDISSKQQLDKFCSQHNVFLNWDHDILSHPSNPEKINFFNNVKVSLGTGNHVFWRVLAKDIDLYNQVLAESKNILN
jgi:hypothetical protein